VRRHHANFTYQAASWSKPRRVIAKVEWHPGELYPRVGFIVTNMSRPRPGTWNGGSSRHCAPVLQEGRKRTNIHANPGSIWGISVERNQM
jgi:hypothetical protein